MSATADSSCGELSEALQRNAKHEARLSNISDLFPFGGNLRIVPEIEILASPRKLSGLRCSFAPLRMTLLNGL
jgi:hypothetical protein